MTNLPPLPPDRHLRRTGHDYAQAFLGLLPHGQAWPREPDCTLVLACTGLNIPWGFVDGRAADLLEIESDPRKTTDAANQYGPFRGLLSDWERAFGLPDPCFPDVTSEEERRAMLVLQMTLLGGQSRQFFERISIWAGHIINIGEFAPFMCGVSEVGETRYEYDSTGMPRWTLGPPELRFYWAVGSETAVLEWFRCGTPYSQCGVHPHLKIITESPMDCLLRRWRPAHTELVFDYRSLRDMGPMAGTP